MRTLSRHRIQFQYESPACDQAILMVGTSKTKLRMDERLMIISHMSYLFMVIFLSLLRFLYLSLIFYKQIRLQTLSHLIGV